jgi:4-amino-4-deoxy-L-arabinose transferase-like glycosyltransferase
MTARFWLLLVFLLILTAIRFFLAAHYELSPDEAYYYLWSQHPDICYYSKGPGVALAILAGTSLFGHSELGVRFLSPLLGLGTSLIVYFLARHLYREKIAFWSVIGLNVLPIFNVGSVVMTIDPLSLFFWAAALYTFWLALERSPAGRWLWVVTGGLIGLGFISKYTNAFQLLSIFLFLLIVPKYRRELIRPGFYLLLSGFLPFLLPPIIWNQQHDWITLAHLSMRGGLNKPFAIHFSSIGRFLGAHLGVYSPLIFVAFIVALFASVRKAFSSTKVCFLLTFSWPILLTYFILAWKEPGEPNWTAPGLISLGILTTSWWLNSARENRAVSRLCVAGLLTAAVMTVISVDLDLLRIVGLKIPYQLDPSARLQGWKTVAEEIGKFRSDFERRLGEPVFLIGNRYQTSSMLSFYLKDPRIEDPGHPPVYITESQDIQNEFSFWPRYDEFIEPTDKSNVSSYFSEQNGVNPFINRTALYITDHGDGAPPQTLQNSFTRWELVAIFQLSRRELPLREIRVFACYQYQTLPL